jgi:type III secretion protein L
MSFVALHHHDGLTLSSDSLLLPPQQVQRFETAHQLAEALALLRDTEHERLDAAQRAARAAGHAQGLAEGRRDAQDGAAEELSAVLQSLAVKSQADDAALRDAVLTLALLVVRRIAVRLPRQELLAALAEQAFDRVAAEQARHSGADSPLACVVRAHPDMLPALQAQIAQRGLQPTLAIEWRGDDSLAALDCVLETPSGRLLAGLEAQLERVRAALRESGHDAQTLAAVAAAAKDDIAA